MPVYILLSLMNSIINNQETFKQIHLYTILTYENLPVTKRATRINIQQFCMLITLHLCVLNGVQKKQQRLPDTSLADWF